MKQIFSPYRICPIGAHIDHQGGAVLGRTIRTGTVIEYEPLESNQLILSSDQLGRTDILIGELNHGHWARYAQAAARVLQSRKGMRAHVSGSLIGSGLSSSASVGLAYLKALADVGLSRLRRTSWPTNYQGENSSALSLSDVVRDALLLIDLWAKRAEPGSVYADITWTCYAGSTVPVRHREIFDLVRQGRDAALTYVQREIAAGHRPFGWEADDACRQVIQRGGYGDQFVHRTGHSIGEEVHGNGANIDSLETRDSRRLMPRTCFSIEPGIYLPGEFGIRSELDVYLTEREALVFGLPLQNEIVPLF